MDAMENLLTRRSVRQYKPDAVPQDVLRRVLEAGTYAATGMGRQSPILVAVTDRATRDALAAENAMIMGRPGTDPFYGAPVVVVVLADRSMPTYVYDGSLVMGNLMLAAHAEGLGSCWIHRAKEEFDSEFGRALLRKWKIDGDYEGIGHCILGYADGDAPQAKEPKADYIHIVE